VRGAGNWQEAVFCIELPFAERSDVAMHRHIVNVWNDSRTRSKIAIAANHHAPLSWASSHGEAMPIIEDYDAIARRLRELNPPARQAGKTTGRLEEWRELAEATAREYVQTRRKGPLADAMLQRRRRRAGT
jgi:hypothetical protein